MFRQQVFVKQFVLARSLEPQGWKRGRAFIVLIPTHLLCIFIDINVSKYKAVFIYFRDKDGLFLLQKNKIVFVLTPGVRTIFCLLVKPGAFLYNYY